MNKLNTRKFLKYASIAGFGGLCTSILFSLKANDYNVNSIGIVRLSRAASTVYDVALLYRRKLYKTNYENTDIDYEKVKAWCHKEAAEKLLELCCKNKGVYIKVGQHIAALDYLVPDEYVKTMRVLHSKAPSSKIKDIYKVLQEDLRADPKEIFKTFDEEPLGAASLAQVHRAELHDGTVVAVKVQHPYVQGNARVDMKTMESLVKIVGWVFPDFHFQWLVDETKKNIPRELDFVQEGKNAEKMSRAFQHYDWLIVPSIRWDLSTPRVLTMEYIEGGQVNDLKYIRKHDINPHEVTDKLGTLYSEMIFLNGFVHSDPHPGNILVKKSDKGHCNIILLDHGLYATLSNEFRVSYANLWLSILNKDRIGMRTYSDKLGIQGDVYGLFACMVSGRSWDSILKGLEGHTKDVNHEKQTMQKVVPRYLPQISGILENVNRQMLLILKTNDLIRGIEHTLGTHLRNGPFQIMTNYCIRSIYQQKFTDSSTKIQKLKVILTERWLLLKLRFYYMFMYMGSLCNTLLGKHTC